VCWYLGAMVCARAIADDTIALHSPRSIVAPVLTNSASPGCACDLQKDSATYMLRDVSQPIKNSYPSDRICEKLKSKDAQICELVFDKKIDLSTVDFACAVPPCLFALCAHKPCLLLCSCSKLRVKELKQILTSWGESCDKCSEKDAFIRRINEVRHKHEAPAAAGGAGAAGEKKKEL
jgi:hypothetical protein